MSRIGHRIISSLLLALLTTSCSVNILSPFADEETDQALFIEAQIQINRGNYSGAVDLFTQMSSDFLEKDYVVPYHASAYAGVCNLDFLNFQTLIDDLGSSRLFEALMSTYTGGTTTEKEARIAACDQAITILEAAGATEADRDDDNNLLISFVLFVKMGTTLSRHADDDSALTNDNDGVLDTNWDACADGDPTADTNVFPEDDVRQFGAALIKAVNSLSAVSSVTVGAGSITLINTLCTSIAGAVPGADDLCTKTDPADFTANEIAGIRTLVNEGTDIGLGSCAAGTPNITNCPCPP